MEAVEAAVARGIKEYSMPDLVVRDMLTSIIQDHLFMPIAEEPGQPPATKSPVGSAAGIPAGPRPAAPQKKVFDKSAWQVPKPTGPAVPAPSSDSVSPASPAPLGGEGNTGQANNGSPVLEGVAGFDRGAFGGGSAAVNRNGH